MTIEKRYRKNKPIGINGNILFFEPVEDDRIEADYVCCFVNTIDGKKTGYRKHKVHFAPSGRAYINKYGRRYLDETMRI